MTVSSIVSNISSFWILTLKLCNFIEDSSLRHKYLVYHSHFFLISEFEFSILSLCSRTKTFISTFSNLYSSQVTDSHLPGEDYFSCSYFLTFHSQVPMQRRKPALGHVYYENINFSYWFSPFPTSSHLWGKNKKYTSPAPAFILSWQNVV